jgi:hypothetical protein
MAQLLLEANVNSFEFQSSNGLTFGYNSSGVLPGAGGSISTTVTKADMDISMQGLNPLSNAMIVGDEETAAQTTQNLNVGINFDGFGVGTNTYSSTALASVSQNGLNLAVQGIKSQYDSVSYIGRVMQLTDATDLMINGGFVTGIKAGDTFNIYNVTHTWANPAQPCVAGNAYYGEEPTPSAPVAVLTINYVDPGSNYSYGSFVLTGVAPSINLGAQVIPLKLVAAASGQPARYLKKKVLIGTVAAKSFTLPGGGTFDFGTAVNGQFSQAVSSNGFVVGN